MSPNLPRKGSSLPPLACVDLPALPLQLLLRRHPRWAESPVVVVERDEPRGRISWASGRARRLGILPGQTYAAALATSGSVRAGVVAQADVERAVAEVLELLRSLTPEVEPAGRDGLGGPGVFWLGGAGLDRLWPTAELWARAVHRAVAATGFCATVVTGFRRFATYAVARGGPGGVRVLRDPAEEARALEPVPLARLDLAPTLREALAALGVKTVGAFLALPAVGLRERFGPEACRWHRLAREREEAALLPAAPCEPLEAAALLDRPEEDLDRLLFRVKSLLDPQLDELVRRGWRLVGVGLDFRLEGGGRREEWLQTAEPTLLGARVLDLVRLRLEGRPLGARVEEVRVEVRGEAEKWQQLRLFVERSRRDAAAGARALARLRAEFGEEAVVRARPRSAHLPEGRFAWESLPAEWRPARPGPCLQVPLVRRILRRPRILPPRAHRLRDDGWLIRGVEHGPVVRMSEPWIVAGGWWTRPLRREYRYATCRRGDVLWVFYDQRRRRWFLQGQVE
ncbi:MAG: DNA polymerase Y family protein [Acidobacteriota bacterium]|nr:DNA polymerase Y family protein [Acidobacteriota bacterium]MDQ7088582.1 DNA polymerase Y family protein [Acidobacteriota bacterium]